jgi:hypothetical protein
MFRPIRSTIGSAAIALTLALLASTAAAQEEDAASQAEQFFRAGRERLALGDNAASCALFRDSLTLFRRASTLLNLAVCSEAQGQLAAALAFWEQGAALLEASDERLEIAKERIASLQLRVPQLTVALPPKLPAGAVLEFDGAVVARASLVEAMRLDPGEHTIVLEAPDHQRSEVIVKLREGDVTTQPIALGARVAPPPPPPHAPVPAPFDPPLPARNIPVWIWPVGGVGAALAIAAIPFAVDHVSTLSEQRELCGGDLDRCAPDPPGSYDPAADNERKFRDAVLAVSFGAGGGALALVALIGAILGERAEDVHVEASLGSARVIVAF